MYYLVYERNIIISYFIHTLTHIKVRERTRFFHIKKNYKNNNPVTNKKNKTKVKQYVYICILNM